ncbi:Os03g0604432 [Oryza sativa Japonica Group]|uniref:Os03g0604432 protein n=1 Tax=Oryza sativa subsp. japonica TaxID=39947 RepID=A0A0P0W044_ORYSJ|nr:hypothetical protein EE612_018820 [Oryza sativa]BAS85215.1 Os03g0604432 [Oryza sativa Japonica Group]
MDLRAATAARPSGVSRPPMRTRSGEKRSWMAVPSARNSGLERIWYLMLPPLLLWARIFSMASAVLTGTVDFSTTILSERETSAMMRAALSQ